MPPQPTLWKRIAFAFVAGPVKEVCDAVLFWFILSLFYAIIMPYRRPKEYSRHAACQSNLRQIALAVQQYRQDEGTYPLTQPPPGPQWTKLYSSKYISMQAFQCPSDNNATDAQKNSYGYNTNLSGRKAVGRKAGISTIMNFEVEALADNKTLSGNNFAMVTAQKRHLDGANYAFADGHVKWLKPEQLSGGRPNGENFTLAVE